jgi:hypothetical protein
MKKQIAILATIIAASGFTAFGQDWISVGDSKGGTIQDDFTTQGTATAAYSGDVTVEILWAKTGVADTFGGTSKTQSVSQVSADISSLLAGGWQWADNDSPGTGNQVATTATGASAIAKGAGGVAAYASPFEISTTAQYAGGNDSGLSIQMIFVALNGANTAYTSATALGISDPFLNEVGSAASDPNADFLQASDTDEVTSGTTGPAQFFAVGPVPEPTTLALAGLGGLSMLFLRRRKA